MEVVLLHNPRAGKDNVPTDLLVAMLRDHGYQPRCFSLKDELDDPAILTTGEFVIAAGGDGSIRDVALRLAHTGRPLAPLPLGTANNIATSLGIRGTPAQIIAGWAQPVRRRIDLGLARGPWGERRFIEGVGVGLVGRAIAIIESIDEASEHHYDDREDELQRDLAVFLALAQEMPPVALTLFIGEHETRDTYLLLEILNITRAGPRLELAPHADMSDGFLDVISLTVAERKKLKQSILKRLAGPTPDLILPGRKARAIRIVSARCDLRIDDELVLQCTDVDNANRESVTVDVEVDPHALEILLPGNRSDVP